MLEDTSKILRLWTAIMFVLMLCVLFIFFMILLQG